MSSMATPETTTYRLVNIDVTSVDECTVYIMVSYSNEQKIFHTKQVYQPGTDDDVICQQAWMSLKNDITLWKQRIDSGVYKIGKTFEPQDDDSIIFQT